MAVNTVNQVYYQDESEDVAGSLVRAIQEANAALQQTNSAMGTTCVAVVLKGDTAYIANVGDSRAYILRKGELKQITEDHSWVAQQVRAGLLTEEQARTHEKSNLIYRCLGSDDVEVDTFSEQVQEGDVLVLCTDGLTRVVSDEELRSIVEQFGPEESAVKLVERANERGGPDNITAIVVRVSL
jgi:serine/threonine protein phosphatase PrpC